MSMSVGSSQSARAFCYVCFKPASTCVCGSVVRLHNRTGVTIVQHPREQHHPLGTARFAELGLQHVRRLVDTERRLRGDVPPFQFPAQTGVLYPSANAIPLDSVSRRNRPTHLIAIDGTWHQARTLYRDMAWLHPFPHYSLQPTTPSRYRIRREPKPAFVSTLEALLAALQLIEPELSGVDQLLSSFDAMIDEQIRREQAAEVHHARRRKRPLNHRRKPRALAENLSNLVVVYAHAVQSTDGERRLLYFAAERLVSGERFHRHILSCPTPLMDEAGMSCRASRRAEHDACVTYEAFASDWRHFTRPHDVLAAWSPAAFEWLPRDEHHRKPNTLSLKAAYRRLRSSGGSLDEIVTVEGLAGAAEGDFEGAKRLAHAKALAWFLHDC